MAWQAEALNSLTMQQPFPVNGCELAQCPDQATPAVMTLFVHRSLVKSTGKPW
jgi:hypothetical protein